VPLSPIATAYDALLLDLDGCVWVGEQATPGAVEALEAWRGDGRRLAFVTNDPRLPPEEYVRKLWRLGFRASAEEVVTVGGAVQHLLHERFPGHTAYVVGAPALHAHVTGAGLRVLNGTSFATRAEVVVVAGHDDLHFDELRLATQAVLRGATLVGASRDRTFPMPDGPWPGSGPVVAAVETATGAEAIAVGKPEPQLFATALDRIGGGRALVVGDRLDADVAGAHAAGLDAAVVLTGATSAEEAQQADRTVRVAPSLAQLLLG